MAACCGNCSECHCLPMLEEGQKSSPDCRGGLRFRVLGFRVLGFRVLGFGV